jgi:glycosyltransferase involved in cell wall biosynthesis
MDKSLPLVTLIMPIRNEAGFIRQSLRAVVEQDYSAHRLEVIVADGMSHDGTREIVESFTREYPSLRLIDNPEKIASTALNRAIVQARGQIIVRVDGHCVIASDYVRMCVKHLVEDGVDGVGGLIETVAETWVARAIAVAMSSPFGVGDSAFRTRTDLTQSADTVPFPAYRRSAIERAGAYDKEQVRNQDDEYNYRLRKLGARILLAADVRSRYYSRSSLGSLWRQYFQYGYWKVRVMQKHPRQMQARQFVPPIFVSAAIGSLVLAFFSVYGQVLLAAVGGSYIIANLTLSLLIGRKKGWRHTVLLPIIFAVLHGSYGLGFVVGVLRFWNRWGHRAYGLSQLKLHMQGANRL